MEKPRVIPVSNSGTQTTAGDPGGQAGAPATAPVAPQGPVGGNVCSAPADVSLAARLRRCQRGGKALIAYLLDSEVHTFAFSVAANAIISFIPFVVLLYALARSVFRSQWPDPSKAPTGMIKVINEMVVYFIPSTADKDWLPRNLWYASWHGGEILSLIMILVACTGIFLPLEVALNKAWGVAKSRNYLYNQTLALGLAVLMVVLGMASIFINEGMQDIVSFLLSLLFFHHTDNWLYSIVFNSVSYLWLAVTTGAACIIFFFFVYWLLPNRKIPWRPVMRTAIYTGVIWLVARVIFAAVLPHLDLKKMYGPFFVSVGLLFWAYVSGLILFAGAQFSAARLGDKTN
jgi:membrane protein